MNKLKEEKGLSKIAIVLLLIIVILAIIVVMSLGKALGNSVKVINQMRDRETQDVGNMMI